jgi:hypothetical protein
MEFRSINSRSDIFILSLILLGINFLFYGCFSLNSDLDRSDTRENSVPKTSKSFFEVSPTLKVPLLPQKDSCEGNNVGIYGWSQSYWMQPNSKLTRYLFTEAAHRSFCGSVTINIADYSNPDLIKNSEMLIPFILNVRRSGNSKIVWMSYADGAFVIDSTKPKLFTGTFFKWLLSLPKKLLSQMAPLGVLYDIPKFDREAFRETLVHATKQRETFMNRWISQTETLVFFQFRVENEEIRELVLNSDDSHGLIMDDSLDSELDERLTVMISCSARVPSGKEKVMIHDWDECYS